VVFCVVNVVNKESSFVVMKNVTRILDLFFGLPVFGKIWLQIDNWGFQLL
jgi:hypothetical protein